MWHRIELNFDGAARVQKLFINGTLQIEATRLHGPARKVWFDDVAVGPTRAGCL